MKDLTPPTPRSRDHVHTAVKIAIGTVPIVGGAAAEIFNTVCQSPLERGRQDWRHAVTNALKDGSISKDIEVLSAVAKAVGIKLVDNERFPGVTNGELCISTTGKFHRWDGNSWAPTD